MAERYRYVEDYSPPAPFAYISLAKPQENSPSMVDIPAQIDSAFDYTVLPQSIIEQLEIVQLGQVAVMGFSNAVHSAPTYLVQLGLKNREPSLVRVLADPNESVPIMSGTYVPAALRHRVRERADSRPPKPQNTETPP